MAAPGGMLDLNSRPLQWKHGVLTIGPPGKSLKGSFNFLFCGCVYDIHNASVQEYLCITGNMLILGESMLKMFAQT